MLQSKTLEYLVVRFSRNTMQRSLSSLSHENTCLAQWLGLFEQPLVNILLLLYLQFSTSNFATSLVVFIQPVHLATEAGNAVAVLSHMYTLPTMKNR